MTKHFGDSDFWKRQAELQQQRKRMTSLLDSLLAANATYADHFSEGDLPLAPRGHAAVITCMDARIDPKALLGLELGEAHVIRNAGGRASDDALRSLIVSSQLQDTREYLVIHHTDCGMMRFTGAELQAQLLRDTDQDASHIDFLAFADLEASVREDVERILTCRYLPPGILVRGFIYDVHTGLLSGVSAGSEPVADETTLRT